MTASAFCRITACLFICMASTTFAASGQEVDFTLVALEHLRDRLQQYDKGKLDGLVEDVSVASGLSATASRDSLVLLLQALKTHCKKPTGLGEEILSLNGGQFPKRKVQTYMVKVAEITGQLLKTNKNVGLEDIIGKAAVKSKLLKYQSIDYTVALLEKFAPPVALEPPISTGIDSADALVGTFSMLVTTRNGQRLRDNIDQMFQVNPGDDTLFKLFKIKHQTGVQRKVLAAHESIKNALVGEFRRFDRVRWTTDRSSAKDTRYTLEYIADHYMFGRDIAKHSDGLFVLQANVRLVVKDMLKNEVLLNKALVIRREIIEDGAPILEEFYREIARAAAEELVALVD